MKFLVFKSIAIAITFISLFSKIFSMEQQKLLVQPKKIYHPIEFELNNNKIIFLKKGHSINYNNDSKNIIIFTDLIDENLLTEAVQALASIYNTALSSCQNTLDLEQMFAEEIFRFIQKYRACDSYEDLINTFIDIVSRLSNSQDIIKLDEDKLLEHLSNRNRAGIRNCRISCYFCIMLMAAITIIFTKLNWKNNYNEEAGTIIGIIGMVLFMTLSIKMCLGAESDYSKLSRILSSRSNKTLDEINELSIDCEAL